ncbi:hypothetical protein SDC9_151585 [bioreactor metagenome]|uniref:Uncharacterized protein n=1 Tax=bioreactor metagenome TaxID=1076179 RepID=A0A645EQQ0_9ZZZZ
MLPQELQLIRAFAQYVLRGAVGRNPGTLGEEAGNVVQNGEQPVGPEDQRVPVG